MCVLSFFLILKQCILLMIVDHAYNAINVFKTVVLTSTIFDWLIAVATVTFSKVNYAATM